jgi:hypothetical protein
MIRKLVIALIATFAKDPYSQIIAALVLVVLSLVLQARVAPYARTEAPMLHWYERPVVDAGGDEVVDEDGAPVTEWASMNVVREDGEVRMAPTPGDMLNNVETLSLLCLALTQIISIFYLLIDSGTATPSLIFSVLEKLGSWVGLDVETDCANDCEPLEWVEHSVTVSLLVLNAGAILLMFFLFVWSKCCDVGYRRCESGQRAEMVAEARAECLHACSSAAQRRAAEFNAEGEHVGVLDAEEHGSDLNPDRTKFERRT